MYSRKNNIPMTGDPKADADIMAFIKARQNILRKGKDISFSGQCEIY